MLDPMCGSGTVLAAAIHQGYDAIGFDVDPLAVLISRVATQPISADALARESQSIVSAARQSTEDRLRWDDAQTISFSEYWFGEKQRSQLSRLSMAIDACENIPIRQALQVALSRIIVTKAPTASLAADTSHGRPHKVLDSSDYDVYEGFCKSAASLGRLLAKRELNGRATVDVGDARILGLSRESVDLVITSPPYLNAIDYLRGHKLSLIWLGYTIPELRRIRSNSIGAERAPEEAVSAEIKSMVDEVARTVDYPDLLPLRMISRYAQDLTEFSRELHRVCKPGAQVVVVIGNSTLKGNYIRNDGMVGRAFENVGFVLSDKQERTIPDSRRYLPVHTRGTNSPMTKRMRKEVVMTMRKS